MEHSFHNGPTNMKPKQEERVLASMRSLGTRDRACVLWSLTSWAYCSACKMR